MSSAAGEATDGRTVTGVPRTVTLERMRGFSGWPARNIHTDEEYARDCGLPGPIATGTMYQSYLAELMIDLFGEDWLRHGSMELAFVRIVEPGDTITAKGTVPPGMPTDTGHDADVHVWCENQRGEPVVVGTARYQAR